MAAIAVDPDVPTGLITLQQALTILGERSAKEFDAYQSKSSCTRNELRRLQDAAKVMGDELWNRLQSAEFASGFSTGCTFATQVLMQVRFPDEVSAETRRVIEQEADQLESAAKALRQYLTATKRR